MSVNSANIRVFPQRDWNARPEETVVFFTSIGGGDTSLNTIPFSHHRKRYLRRRSSVFTHKARGGNHTSVPFFSFDGDTHHRFAGHVHHLVHSLRPSRYAVSLLDDVMGLLLKKGLDVVFSSGVKKLRLAPWLFGMVTWGFKIQILYGFRNSQDIFFGIETPNIGSGPKQNSRDKCIMLCRRLLQVYGSRSRRRLSRISFSRDFCDVRRPAPLTRLVHRLPCVIKCAQNVATCFFCYLWILNFGTKLLKHSAFFSLWEIWRPSRRPRKCTSFTNFDTVFPQAFHNTFSQIWLMLNCDRSKSLRNVTNVLWKQPTRVPPPQ